MDSEKLMDEAIEIYSFVTCDIPDDITALPEIGSKLAVFMARTGKMYADAGSILNKAKKVAYEAFKGENLSPLNLKEYVNAACADEQYLCDMLERLNKTCTHQLDWVRTLISKAKAEMQYVQHG